MNTVFVSSSKKLNSMAWVRKWTIPTVGESLRWPRDTLYPLKLALTSPPSGGRSVNSSSGNNYVMKGNFMLFAINILMELKKKNFWKRRQDQYSLIMPYMFYTVILHQYK
jgi:hypothetical protein